MRKITRYVAVNDINELEYPNINSLTLYQCGVQAAKVAREHDMKLVKVEFEVLTMTSTIERDFGDVYG